MPIERRLKSNYETVKIVMVSHYVEVICNEIVNLVSRYFIAFVTAVSTIYNNSEYKHEGPTSVNGGRAISIGREK